MPIGCLLLPTLQLVNLEIATSRIDHTLVVLSSRMSVVHLKLSAVFTPNGVFQCTNFKPVNTLRFTLVWPKEKVPQGKWSGTVYQCHCLECISGYVSNTACAFDTRVHAEHRRPSTNNAPFGDHQKADHNRDRKLDLQKYIGQANGLVPEVESKRAIHIRTLKSDLNRDRAGTDFLEFTSLYCVRNFHVIYVTLR